MTLESSGNFLYNIGIVWNMHVMQGNVAACGLCWPFNSPSPGLAIQIVSGFPVGILSAHGIGTVPTMWLIPDLKINEDSL